MKTRITRTRTVLAMTPTTTLMMTVTTLATATTKVKLITKNTRPRFKADSASAHKTSTGAWHVSM